MTPADASSRHSRHSSVTLPGVLGLALGADLADLAAPGERSFVVLPGVAVTSIRVGGHELLQAGPALSRAFARVRP